MNKIKAQTLKGFRDFLPEEVRKRQYVINKLKAIFESFGFEPLETTALEYETILLGKYGEEGDKLMYRFEDNGGRKVALRYDQTVPLARVVAQYQNKLLLPFKRYQIQPVWRAENPQKGRFREFLQCDIDTVGSSSSLADAEILAVVDRSLKALGFKDYQIKINDRRLLFEKIKKVCIGDNLSVKVIREIDKIDKIGWPRLEENLIKLGLSQDIARSLDTELSITQPVEQIPYLDDIIEAAKKLGATSIIPKLYLARGLDYYTGMILEVAVKGYLAGSVGGGGRYDNLIGMFAGRQISAVGFSFGFDRLVEAMDQQGLFPKNLMTTKVLVTIFNPDLLPTSLTTLTSLRNAGINTEVWLDPNSKLEKQLKYADQKGIPYVVIIGPEEVTQGKIIIKDLKNRTQQSLSLDELISKLTS